MKKRTIIQVLSLVLLGSIIIGAVEQYTPTAKEVVISSNIRKDIKAEEEEVDFFKRKAKEYLKQSNFEEAKALYEKAILMDETNKDLYIEIKDEYINCNRLDDAYRIIKMAIDNKVDVDNMMTISSDIKSRFDKIEYSHSTIEGQKYELPSEGVININGEDITVPISWTENEVNTNNTGMFVYEGVNEQYGRSFILNLDVQYRILTESEIRQMCIETKKAIDDVIYCENLDQNKIIRVDGRTFAPSYKYKTRQQIIDSLSNYCTIDTINDLLDNDTIDRDGELNICCGNFGEPTGLSPEYDNLKVEQTETVLTAVYIKQWSEEEVITQTYKFEKINGSWLLTDYYIYK